jgi:hypothetical protein
MKTLHGWRRLALGCTLLGTLVALNGCSTGGGTGAGNGGGTRSVDVYVTDGFREDFKQVLITLYKVEGSTDGTNFQTLFEDSTGLTLDVARLRNSAQLLSRINAPSGSYTQIRVTVAEKITLQATGGANSTQITIAPNIGVHSNGQVSLTFSKPAKVGENKIVVDFKLAQFQLAGGHIHPVVGSGDTSEFEQKARICRIPGVISNLQAGTSFVLTPPHGSPFTVTLTQATQILQADAGNNSGTLANGQFVIIEGQIDRQAQTIAAGIIRILPNVPGTPAEPPRQERFSVGIGTVSAIDATKGTFTLTLTQAFRFNPDTTTITVQTNGDTKFRKSRHEEGQFSDLINGMEIAVGGNFTKETGVMTAKFVMENPPPRP